MYSIIKYLKPIIFLTVFGLISSQAIISLSQFCYCNPEKPQVEILSFNECNHEGGCTSDHQHCKKNIEHLKMSHKNCTYSFIEQLVYTEQKNAQIQNIASINFYIDFNDELSEYSLLFSFAKTERNLSHNRFIDIINEVQLLI